MDWLVEYNGTASIVLLETNLKALVQTQGAIRPTQVRSCKYLCQTFVKTRSAKEVL